MISVRIRIHRTRKMKELEIKKNTEDKKNGKRKKSRKLSNLVIFVGHRSTRKRKVSFTICLPVVAI